MNLLKQIYNCKLMGNHNMVYKKGYGFRCTCCGKTLKQVKGKEKQNGRN